MDFKVYDIAIIFISTDKNVALIYSSQFVNRKQRVMHCQAALNIMNLSMLSPRVGGGGMATQGKLTERAFPGVGILTFSVAPGSGI